MNEILEAITSRLPEVLTVLLSGIISFVCSEFFFKWIFLKIQNRTKDKFSAPIYKEIQGIREDMRKAQEEQGKYIIGLVDEAFEKEAQRKKEVYKEITQKEVPEKEQVIEENIIEETPDVVEAEPEISVETSLF